LKRSLLPFSFTFQIDSESQPVTYDNVFVPQAEQKSPPEFAASMGSPLNTQKSYIMTQNRLKMPGKILGTQEFQSSARLIFKPCPMRLAFILFWISVSASPKGNNEAKPQSANINMG
jgi:hypothetical protein